MIYYSIGFYECNICHYNILYIIFKMYHNITRIWVQHWKFESTITQTTPTIYFTCRHAMSKYKKNIGKYNFHHNAYSWELLIQTKILKMITFKRLRLLFGVAYDLNVSFFHRRCCRCFRVVPCVSFCTGHFVMVPLNMTYQHCLQHSLFEHLFNLYHHVNPVIVN